MRCFEACDLLFNNGLVTIFNTILATKGFSWRIIAIHGAIKVKNFLVEVLKLNLLLWKLLIKIG
jgi:hypothetical protein